VSINPFVFIGVGGSGGRTLGVIRQSLKDVLDRVGWQSAWPRGWQFVHIDVPANPDGKSRELPYLVPRTDYVSLTDARSTYLQYDQAVSQSLRRAVPGEAHRYVAWDCWRPVPPSAVRVNIVNGAGQYRAIGRVCAMQCLGKIDNALDRALQAATNAEAGPQLLRIQRLMGEGSSGLTERRPVIFVLGSVAGGSGSGMLLDVCDILRARGYAEINAVVLTPEVFERAGGGLDPGIAPNTFSALNELANSMWTTSQKDAPVSRDLLFSRAGVRAPVGHGGPSTVFLVGRRNGSVTFTDTWDVYKIVGRSLAELALNESLTQSVVAYDFANAHALAQDGLDGLELSSPNAARDLAPFRSLGFARLSVGRDFFERYAADRLIRAAAVKLLDAHLLRRQPGDTSSDEELLEALVEEAWPAFLRDSELDEFEHNNAITDRLNTEKDLRVTRATAALMEKVRHAIGLTAVRGKVRAIEARQAVAREIQLERRADAAILKAGETAVGELAREFQQAIQKKLSAVVSAVIAANGLPSAGKLIGRLIIRSKEASTSLVHDMDVFERKEREDLQALRSPPAGRATEFPVGAAEPVQEIIRRVQTIVNVSLRHQYHEAAKRLLDDLITNLLEPWRRALGDAEDLLRREARPANQISVLDVWPGAKGVPDYLQPSKVEFLLDEVDRFPEAFTAIIDQSVTGASDLAAIELAIEEVISGINLCKASNAKPTAMYAMAWSPKWEAARQPRCGSATAEIEIRTSLADLRARTHDWIWDDEKAIGRYVRQTMADYLSDRLVPGYELADRRNRLVGQFSAMVKASMPLVALDPAMTQAIHGHSSPPYSLHITPLNVPGEFKQELEEIAYALLQQPQPVPVTTHPRSDGMMMTLLAEPYHMIEFASIMDPVTDQWARQSGSRDYWLYRRARPLNEWVPLGPAALEDLVRGWFMARILGRGFASPANATELWFVHHDQPIPLARAGVRPATRHDHLGMVVEGLAMAMLEGYRSRSLAPLVPYRALIALGGSWRDEDNQLQRWLDSGGPLQAREFGSANLDTFEGRLEAALALVNGWEKSYRQDLSNVADPAVAQRHPSYEINDEILGALADIRDRLSIDGRDDLPR
jgi:Tubulin like